MKLSYRRWVIFLVSLVPLVTIFSQALLQQLGADPAKQIVWFTGKWAFYFLLLTLVVTPAKRLMGWSWISPHRRMLGLFTLFYALLHLTSYITFILGFDFSSLAAEFIERPYIAVTIPAVLLLIILGITSTQGMMKRLGKHWVKLHKSIYLVAALAWVHVLWQVRSSYFLAVEFGLLVILLLGIRFYWWAKRR